MIIDRNLFFADAQTGTSSEASTDIVDTLAKGQSYKGAFLCVRVDTAYAATGAPTNKWQLQTDDDSGFYDAVTIAESSALLAHQLSAGTYVMKVRIPPSGLKRWLRVYKVKSPDPDYGAAIFTAGKWDAFVTQDVDVDISQNHTAS